MCVIGLKEWHGICNYINILNLLNYCIMRNSNDIQDIKTIALAVALWVVGVWILAMLLWDMATASI